MSGTPHRSPEREDRAPRSRPPVLVAYSVFAGLGLLFLLGSLGYPWTNPEDGTVGPGALPRTAGLLLLVTGLALLWQEMRGGTLLEGDGHVEEETEHTAEEKRATTRKLLVVSAGLVVTAALIPFLGMLPALALLTLFLTVWVERLRWPVAVTASAGVLVVCYLLFVVLLRVPLPLGLLDPALWSAP
ncbi:tripartite tricarboxylate transporter TctB family protein [Nocardiopsis synnemataformans]|uniref:tripartite tricarboxylate transporter TctB family protein n=1 Tax=Nocardiopsis synnemataformans TaxID=61305 RepID=UPI003EBEB8AA